MPERLKWLIDENPDESIDLNGIITGKFHEVEGRKDHNPIRRKLCDVRDALFHNGRKRTWESFTKELDRLWDIKYKQVLEEEREKALRADPQYAHYLLDLWLETIQVSVKKKTFNSYNYTAGLYKHYVNDHLISKTNDVVVAPFKQALQTVPSKRTKKPLSKITQYDYFKYIAEIFLTWCKKNGYLDKEIKLTGFKKPLHKRHSLNIYDLQKIWIHIKDVAENGMMVSQVTYGRKKLKNEDGSDKVVHYVRKHDIETYKALQTYMIVMVYTGMRASEVWALRWDQINLEGGYIDLDIFNKAEREDTIALRTLLWDFLLERRSKTNLMSEVFLVDNGHGDTFYKNPEQLSKQFGKVFRRLGIHKKPTHGFRFTLATTMKGKKIDIQMQQNVMRHRDVKTLEGYQDPFYVEETRKELDKLPDPLA